MSKKKQYPYEILDIKNLPGERWKDIKGYKGIYQVSSHGRIKCLERKMYLNTDDRGRVPYVKTERIKRQKIIIKANDYAGSPVYQCTVSVLNKGKERTFKLNRLVYEYFVAPIPTGKERIMICQKDSDGRNNHYKNLIPMTQSQISKRAIEVGRKRVPYDITPKATLKKMWKHLSIIRQKPVQRISATGRVLKNYDSIADAAADVGCDRSYLTEILTGRKPSVKGWYFRYKK
ncbi:MAG: hypothetical protein J7497_05650 [Chitinophagaceae bacterium]|nr:hypothetical protein [Chitinophagaceae bacterium]